MECRQVQEIIGDYVAHRLEPDKVSELEAHLCICTDCRAYLSQRLESDEDGTLARSPGTEDAQPAGETLNSQAGPVSEPEKITAPEPGFVPSSETSSLFAGEDKHQPFFVYFALALACLAVLFIFVLFLKTRTLGI